MITTLTPIGMWYDMFQFSLWTMKKYRIFRKTCNSFIVWYSHDSL